MVRAAFFDIDGTLTRSSLTIALFEMLVKNKLVSNELWTREIKPRSDDYQKRYLDYDSYHDTVAISFVEAMKGLKYDFVDTLAHLIVKDNKDIVYTYTRKKIKDHLKNKDLVFFISGSPEFLVKHMAEAYGVTGYRGTVYLTDDNMTFTGDYIKMWDSASKKKVLDELVKTYDIDLKESYAYGDTGGDITMLESVGNPVAINPNYKLLDYINSSETLKEKTKIIIERKDVIFSIEKREIFYKQGPEEF